MKKIKSLAFLIAPLTYSVANATESWYIVNNYKGTIGNYPIKLSLQYYDFGGDINVEGSYYYNKYRSPIPLYGKKTSTSITLCEASNEEEYNKYIINGDKYKLDKCQFNLTDNDELISGVWKEGGDTLDVILKKTNSLTKYSLSSSVGKSIDIPFWGQTDKHSFIGVYEKIHGEILINTIRVINKKPGR